MASQINANNSGFGGIVSTGDSSGVLQLQTAGTTAVTIDTSQNVGIGTSSPSYKLDVNGVIHGNNLLSLQAGSNSFPASGYGWEIYNLDSSNNVQQSYNRTGSAWMNSVYGALSHQFKISGSEAMRIDSSGRVTTPYQPFCFATPPTSYAISGGTDTTIGGTWTTVSNIGSHFNTSGGVFTAPVAGVYLAMWSLFFSANTGNRFDVYISVNGSQISRAEQQKWGTNNVNNTSFISTAYKLNANDTITFGAYCGTSTSTYSSAVPWSYAAVYLLG